MGSNVSHGVAAVIVASFAMPTVALSQSRTTLPSMETQNAIQSLQIEKAAPRPDLREFKVDPEKLTPESRKRLTLDSQGKASIPWIVPNTMIIQFEPDTSKESIDNLLKRRNLKVVDKFSNLGAVKVETDLSKYFASELNDVDANQALLRGATRVIEDFKQEPMVRTATPDFVFSPQAQNDELTSWT
jgi:hypothetical protein